MFKRSSIGVLVAVVLALGVTSVVFAQDPTPPTPPTDDVCPFGGTCGGYGRGGYGMGGLGYQGTVPGILADELGMTLDELYEALSDGQTVAELAAAQGVELEDLVDALIAPRAERLAQAVDAGFLTQEQADSMIEMMTTQMASRLENFGLGYGSYGGYRSGGCGMWGGGHRGGWGGGRWGGGWGSSNTFAPRFPQQAAPSGTNL